MRWLLLVAVALLAAAPAHATRPPGAPPVAVTTPAPRGTTAAGPGATVAVSGYPLVCGRPSGTLKVVFPAAARLPRTISPQAVTLSAGDVARVQVARRTVTITLLPHGITCHSIALGPLTIHFATSAHVRLVGRRSAPATVQHATRAFRARVTIVA